MAERVYPLVERYDRKLNQTVWVETHPDVCPGCGCDWTRPGTVLPRHRPCGEHRGHREWVCAACGHVLLDPPADANCGESYGGPRF